MGVKSLWSLLTPVGRPVMLETMEGKAVAIDSSIWIYQFQATMRAKDGRALVNAHVLGFLRRICKLLFYGMKPVFVFDGGAPALKRETLNERRKKKSGAAQSHAKLAERLLAAQLRREALKHVKNSSSDKGKGKAPTGPVVLDDDTVYLEDIDPTISVTPRKTENKPNEPTSSAKKNKFYDHDPYRLPHVDLEDVVARATRSSAPDPRLATEEELRTFIEDMRPEDFDVSSPAFRELPTEVQYEIVGDLRLKSRQTSYTRLQQMLKSAPTPLDFSKQQIKNLKQRNSLTQQLLSTTDSIGKAHISIPVRIASERNKEYVLIRNEEATGGWILGIRDEGTKQKPIVIDHEDGARAGMEQSGAADSEEDDEMEEVNIPVEPEVDPDLRQFRRESALSAIARRYQPKPLAPLTTKPQKKTQTPLFDLDSDEEGVANDSMQPPPGDYWEEDEETAFAIQQSLDYAQRVEISSNAPASSSSVTVLDEELAFAIQESLDHANGFAASANTSAAVPDFDSSMNTTRVAQQNAARQTDAGRLSRLETALSIANAGPSRSSSFGQPFLLNAHTPPKPQTDRPSKSTIHPPLLSIKATPSTPSLLLSRSTTSIQSPPREEALSSVIQPKQAISPLPENEENDIRAAEDIPAAESGPPVFEPIIHRVMDAPAEAAPPELPLFQDSDQELELVNVNHPSFLMPTEISDDDDDMEEVPVAEVAMKVAVGANAYPEDQIPDALDTPRVEDDPSESGEVDQETIQQSVPHSPFPATQQLPDHSNHSRPPTPPVEEHWDAADEMNPDAEEGEFARFMSQVKGRNIDDVRRDIDAEIATLDQQRKNAMRDSEDVNQQMVTQIMMMLRLFGIPYVTAPMEAEAQCAELVALKLVDGIITDDSDVFLFGGQRVFKNMFNQSKTVECFLLSDLSRELGLEQGTLIRLAYLLGSDYVDGLPGVGPVVAMELLKEFPGDDGLHKFKDWWTKVQSGKDKENDNTSSFRKRFKKKFKDLYLPPDWPNPAVRDAYYHPTVDESDEPFKWGLPDLDALREFLREELSWGQSKVDDLLLPIIQKMGKRGQASALNRQGNMNAFLDISAGSGSLAPRKRQAYASKRLQQVVSDFRKKRKNDASASASSTATPGPSSEDDEISQSQDTAPPPPKKKPRVSSKGKGKGKEKADSSSIGRKKPPTTSTRGGRASRGRGKAKARAKRNQDSSGEDDDDNADDGDFEHLPESEKAMDTPPPIAVNLRPRPKPRPVGRAAETPTSA